MSAGAGVFSSGLCFIVIIFVEHQNLLGGMCDFLLKQDREHRSRAFRVAALKNMQDWIDANRVWNDRRIDRHHLAVRIFAGELIAGVVLFCVLAAVL